MGEIISICNQKGGVGKTSTAINLSSTLAFKNKKVLLIDMDPLGNASIGLGIDKDFSTCNIYDVLLCKKEIRECIHSCEFNFSIIPFSIDLAMADLELSNPKESVLKNKLEVIKSEFDYIIIDCPPSLGVLNTIALTASNSCIVPVQCEYYAIEGLISLLTVIRKIQAKFNKDLTIKGVLLTMFDLRIKMNHDIMIEAKSFFDERVFKTSIPRCIKIPMSQKKGKPVLYFDKKCSATKAYLELAEELISQNG